MFKFELNQQVYSPSIAYPGHGQVIGRSEFSHGEPQYLVSIECSASADSQQYQDWLNESLLENIYKHPDFATYKEI